jgi:sigma54-dependent transcription regulator
VKARERERNPCRPTGPTGSGFLRDALLSQQSQRREIEYRVIGVNSAGIRGPSNAAAVVL